mmetsp:Transcript_32503/g.107127  ORF Transcript_32503/g.107127 Transcript_32503/m.107127 type:complete len:202 (-) Transcript_32503:711-1316(-)
MRGNVEQRDIAIQQGLGGEQLRTHEPQARQTHGELPGRSVGGRMELQLTTQVEAQLQDPCHAASELVSSRNVESCCEGEGPCREGRHIHAKLHSPEKLALVFDDLTCGHAFSVAAYSSDAAQNSPENALAEHLACTGVCTTELDLAEQTDYGTTHRRNCFRVQDTNVVEEGGRREPRHPRKLCCPNKLPQGVECSLPDRLR